MSLQLTIPMALQLVIEDVGWWEKSHPVGPDDPFRSGLHRRHHPLDYAALVHLAKGLGMRPLIAFVACEWDRTNILKKIPSTTWMGADWDNRHNVGPWLDQAAGILNAHRDHLEIGLHGVGHEYWGTGHRSRTEFHTPDGEMRPREHIQRHLEAFGTILEQNGLGPFPTAFVPPGLNHSFGNGERGIHPILNRFGIRYVTTDLNKARMHRPRQHPRMAWESGVLLIDRGLAPVPWHTIAARPQFAFDRPILSLHWANLLDEDFYRNLEVVRDWVAFIKSGIDPVEQMLAPDTATCWSQFSYRTLARVRPVDDRLEIDISALRQLPPQTIQPVFYIRIQHPQSLAWRIAGGQLQPVENQDGKRNLLAVRPDDHTDIVRLTPAPGETHG
ncbi:hypothetical protein DSCO28_42300 [Desulfosarcina ovata subsp. sediminis]|uniref:Uncharacterized protein n=1 Tax=Desulfosarcina ovata subsp. sediminis TaxID=885957 RepID=A0A5K7ZU11_9BACT|nr:hypothetical protein [Desulfosarcina ovata]BBO83664.1 hypothetical protein DSCO28_42300 [Desulfosarcina ovata subsp. sediminis]